jgi:hypothetical protein
MTMRTNSSQRWPRLLIVTGVVCCVILEACIQRPQPATTLSFPLVSSPTSTSVQLPAFLSRVEPRSDARVIGVISGRVVWAVLRLEEIAEPGEVLGLGEMQDRVEFLIDGKALDAEVAWGPKPGVLEVEVIGDFEVGPGKHAATVRVRTTSGEVLKHSWTFTVFAEEPRVPDLPEGLWFVRPLPHSTITKQAYQQEQLVDFFPVGPLQSGVCVGILPYELANPNELCLECEDAPRRYSIVALDGTLPDNNAARRSLGEGETVGLDYANGNTVEVCCATAHYECYVVDLASGEHEATVRLVQASGEEIKHTWYFTITED